MITIAQLRELDASLSAYARKSITASKFVDILNAWLDGADAAALASMRGGRTNESCAIVALRALGGWQSTANVTRWLVENAGGRGAASVPFLLNRTVHAGLVEQRPAEMWPRARVEYRLVETANKAAE